MKKITLTALALIALAPVHVRAGDPSLDNVRPLITVNGVKDQNKLTPDASSTTMVVENITFGPEAQRPFIIRTRGKATTAAIWQEYSLTFTPEKSGYLWLSLEGEYPGKDKPNLVFKVDYDVVQVTGGTIENGDFEERTADGKPKFWVYSKDVIPNGSQKALLGSNFVTATANNRIGIGLLATGGQPVTIKFNARAHSE